MLLPTNKRSEPAAVLSRRPTYVEEMTGPQDAARALRAAHPRARCRRRLLLGPKSHDIGAPRRAVHEEIPLHQFCTQWFEEPVAPPGFFGRKTQASRSVFLLLYRRMMCARNRRLRAQDDVLGRQMVTFFSFALAAVAVLLAVPAFIFFVEVFAAVALPQRHRPSPLAKEADGDVAVLVPAHNESAGLLPTLEDIKAQLRPADRVLVVADNCTDDTAAVAAAAGADVISRHDLERTGKGYALAWGLRHLEANPPDIVIVIDADCRLADTLVAQLAAACAVTRKPVQALDLMIAAGDSAINSRVAEFAWRVKNWVRPLGLKALGLPCQLMGTGMAFPWDVIRSTELASGLIVEDLKLGLDLAAAGNAPVFLPSACITSEFPSSLEGTQTQRRRWEKGHLGMILTMVPHLIVMAIRQTNLGLLALTLDVSVPPLSLLGMLVVAVFVVSVLATLLGFSSIAILVSTASLMAFTIGSLLSWLKFGRDVLPPSAILLIAPYIIRKLPLYGRMLFQRSRSQWIRSDRRRT
jgi:cellulose synthase/poly-beta-1,6-N-acetylglucosamine synthase-like glycosyltransferase